MKNINGKQLREKVNNKQKVVNIDNTQDYKKRHIAGAINIPFNDKEIINKITQKVGDKKEELIICCEPTIAKQAREVMSKLEQLGFINIVGHTLGSDNWKKMGVEIFEIR